MGRFSPVIEPGSLPAVLCRKADMCPLWNRKAEGPDKGSPGDEASHHDCFHAGLGERRKPGTGCVTQIGDHLWEGKYSTRGPNGKQRSGTSTATPRKSARRS